jgi:hypothetical protein
MPQLPPFLINEYPHPVLVNPHYGSARYAGGWDTFTSGVSDFFTGASAREKEAAFLQQEADATRALEDELIKQTQRELSGPPAWSWMLLIVTGAGILYAVTRS